MHHQSQIRKTQRKRAFTLTELLVTIMIIGVLAAILIPSIQAIRNSAEVSKSVSHLRSTAGAFILFSTENQGRLPGSGTAFNERWMHQVAPFLDYPADREVNGIPLYSWGYDVDEFRCPALSGRSCPETGERFIARFGYNLNLTREETDASGDPVFILGVPMAVIADPASTVMLATKSGGQPGVRPQMFPNHPWGVAANYRSDRNPRAADVGSGKIGRHAYAFCDGHVEVWEEFIGEEAFTID